MDLDKPATLLKCDMWSIGVILYFLFYGQLPYSGSNTNKLVKDIIRGKLKCKSEHKLPEIVNFIDLVKSLLSNKPQDRPDAATALNHLFLKKPLTRTIVLTNVLLEKTKSTLIKLALQNELKHYQKFVCNFGPIKEIIAKIFSEHTELRHNQVVNGLSYMTEDTGISNYILQVGLPTELNKEKVDKEQLESIPQHYADFYEKTLHN